MTSNNRPVDPREHTDDAVERVEEWRSQLLRLAAGSFSDISETSFLGREMRGGAVVAAMAELEATLREMLISIGHHITASRVAIRDLSPSLRPLATFNSFQSLTEVRDSEKSWTHRLNLTQLENSSEIAALPARTLKSPQPPLEGRTIQPKHISLVWRVLGLTVLTPSASTVASLKKMSQIRNDIAHRNRRIQEVFSEAGRTATDLASYLGDISLLVLQIGMEWEDYIQMEKYLRSSQPAN